jgi:ABC-type nickel/cobalt efflux system permease component RcnA
LDLLSVATGFFLGARHCLEPDHLTAVAHFASAARTPRQGLRSGLLWGVGHGVSVLVVGLALSGLHTRLAGFEPMAERAVGLTLIALSIWRLRSLARRPHVHEHRHEDGLTHTHPHRHAHEHAHLHAPTFTGLVHGAAGALGVVALLGLTAPAFSVLVLAASFAVGTLVAMGLAGWLATRLYGQAAHVGWERGAVLLTAASGFALGVFWIATA